MVSVNILFVETVGINALVVVRFVQNVIISWVTQNPNMYCTIVKCFAITTVTTITTITTIININEMLIEPCFVPSPPKTAAQQS